jgi:hypothetical protein
MLGSDLVASRLSWDCAGNMTPDYNLSQLKSYSLSNGRCRNPTSSEKSERGVVLVPGRRLNKELRERVALDC